MTNCLFSAKNRVGDGLARPALFALAFFLPHKNTLTAIYQ